MSRFQYSTRPKQSISSLITPRARLFADGTATRAAVAVGMYARALGKDSTVGRPPALRHVHLLNAVPAESIGSDGVGDGLAVEQEGLLVEVGDVIAGEMVVDIVGNTDLAAEEDRLLRGLDLLSAGEETARGDAVLDKGGVVGAAAELGGDGGGTVGAEEVLKLLLDGTGAGGSSQVEGVAITIIDTVDVVGARNLYKGVLAKSSSTACLCHGMLGS